MVAGRPSPSFSLHAVYTMSVCRGRYPATWDPQETVKTSLQPWQLLLLVLAGWVNRQQQDAIALSVARTP